MSGAGRSSRSAAALRNAVGACRRAIGRLAAPCTRTERALHVGIATLSLAVTFMAFWSARQVVEERAAAHFERESSRTVRALTNRMAHYEDALQAGVAALDGAGGRMDRDTWRRFASGLELTRRYPGVNGIGLVERTPAGDISALEARERAAGAPAFAVHPRTDVPVRFPITFIEPQAVNREAVGLDLAHETNRYLAATDAMASGEARITGPVVLVQDDGRTPGFLFFTPYRAADRALAPAGAPAGAFDGLVYSPFVVADLVSDALPRAERDVDLRLVDAGTVLHDELGRDDGGDGGDRIDERTDGTLDRPEASARTIDLPMYGRTWTMEMRPAARLPSSHAHLQPLLVLIGGLVIDAMILGLFFSIMRTRRALERSADIGAELAERSRELERSNRELERFACTVSHDLKTPLRGIGDLAWYLEEDLEPLLASGRAHPDVPRHLERIGLQTRRMGALIDGILDYSGIGAGEAASEAVDTAVLLAELDDLHATHAGQLAVDGPAPVLETSRVRLAQVLGNLVGNAFKYHPSPSGALVRVSFEPHGAAWRIRVSDDGPGIDPKYHERIFEMFQTLRPKDAASGTGVGLAIVRRTVEHVGGSVRVESVPGEGATFVVDWPARTLTHARAPRVKTAGCAVVTGPTPPELPKAA